MLPLMVSSTTLGAMSITRSETRCSLGRPLPARNYPLPRDSRFAEWVFLQNLFVPFFISFCSALSFSLKNCWVF